MPEFQSLIRLHESDDDGMVFDGSLADIILLATAINEAAMEGWLVNAQLEMVVPDPLNPLPTWKIRLKEPTDADHQLGVSGMNVVVSSVTKRIRLMTSEKFLTEFEDPTP